MNSLRSLALTLLGLVACGPAQDPNTAGTDSTAVATASADMPAPAPSAEAPPTSQPSASVDAPRAEAPKSKTFSLAEWKLPLSIELPEDAKLQASESKDGMGGATVDSKTVGVRIMKADAKIASIAAAKKTLTMIKHKAATEFVKEEADLLIYKRGEHGYSFLVLVKQGGVTYGCQDLGGSPTQDTLQAGIAACRSIKKS